VDHVTYRPTLQTKESAIVEIKYRYGSKLHVVDDILGPVSRRVIVVPRNLEDFVFMGDNLWFSASTTGKLISREPLFCISTSKGAEQRKPTRLMGGRHDCIMGIKLEIGQESMDDVVVHTLARDLIVSCSSIVSSKSRTRAQALNTFP